MSEPEAGGPGGPALAERPQPVRWATANPGADLIYIREPCWPADPALAGRLVAVLYSNRVRNDASVPALKSRLWWLQLNPDATEIVAAGPLIELGSDATAEEDDEYLPAVGTTRDGAPLLAYLVGIRSSSTLELRTAPILLEYTSHGAAPLVPTGSIRRLAV